MKKVLAVFLILCCGGVLYGAEPESVKIGCYLENLRNFDYLGGVFRADLYIWVESPINAQEPIENLDFVRARTIWASPIIKKEAKGRHYECRRYMIEVNHDWDISRFPFDTQRLMIKIEDIDRSATELNFVADPDGNFAPHLIPAEWEIINKKIFVNKEKYGTNFGDTSDGRDSSKYSRFIIEVTLVRHALPLFFKMVAGAYAAFAAICLSFWLTSDIPTYVSARVGLIVGCLFGVIINQRVVEAVIGRSSYGTHIDAVHLTTLGACILAGIVTLISTRLSTHEKIKQARLLDRTFFWIFLVLYVGFNIALVSYDCWRIATVSE
jgi:hypothetical protein